MKTIHGIPAIIALVAALGFAAACEKGNEGSDVGIDPVETTETTETTPGETLPDTTPTETVQETPTDIIPDEIPPTGGLVADHQAAGQFGDIPSSFIEAARSSFTIYYGHTSHGSQVVTGISMLEAEDAAYTRPALTEDSPDLGYPEWEPKTRAYLDANPGTNLVMWSWCGQMSSLTTDDVDNYLSLMSALETDYPSVTFVYMTGHLDGTGVDGTLYANNNRVRDYCATNDKVLFDFADIESYDPDGTYYPDGADDCAWCTTWCESHECPACDSCAHSHCFNCYQKGKAFWWMVAHLAGWEGP